MASKFSHASTVLPVLWIHGLGSGEETVLVGALFAPLLRQGKGSGFGGLNSKFYISTVILPI